MKTMETELERLNSELYAMYQRSLEYAVFKWLPYITPKNGSYNSYPHIKGIMRHIDRLLYGDEENNFSLNGSELYILLCAILMHDIGKGVPKDQLNSNKVADHAWDSYDIIRKQWAVLGLPTEKAAEIVADICLSHDCKERSGIEKLHTKYYIDQFNLAEPIRGRLLGALLFLGDHMDNTFTRSKAPFFREQREIVGKFRSKIADVRLDRQYKMIREIMDKTRLEAENIDGIEKLQGDLYQYLLPDLGESTAKKDQTSLLYVLAKDAMDNEKQIALIKDELNIMGMPVKKWLIECDEHLFQIKKRKDQEGNTIIDSSYALEPIINLDYCLEVLKGICMLSGGIFARQFFKYSELVNFIREEESNTYKVKCAVRRLSLLLKAKKGSCDYVIYYDENNWSFYCQNDKSSIKNIEADSCDQKDIVYDTLEKIIKERLGEQNGEK